MTLEQIIQAHQSCFIDRDHQNCPLKAYGSTITECRKLLATNTIDLLRRQENEIEALIERNLELSEAGEKVCLELIKTQHQPAADVNEVVHCGECIHRRTRPQCAGRRMDFFCADGKRKEATL